MRITSKGHLLFVQAYAPLNSKHLQLLIALTVLQCAVWTNNITLE